MLINNYVYLSNHENEAQFQNNLNIVDKCSSMYNLLFSLSRIYRVSRI